MDRLRLIRLLRPQFWILSIVPASAGAILALGEISLLNILLVSTIVSAISGLAEVVNNYVDRDSDAEQKLKRFCGIVLSGGSGIRADRLSLGQSIALSLFLMVAAFTAAAPLRFEVNALIALGVGMAVFYSIKPVTLKERGLWGTLDMVFGRGLVSFHIGWVAFSPLTRESLAIGCFLSLLNFGSATLSHLADYEEDRSAGIETFPVRVGFHRAAQFAAIGMLGSLLLLTVMIYLETRVNFIALPLSIFTLVVARAIATLTPEDKKRITRLQSTSMLLFLWGSVIFF